MVLCNKVLLMSVIVYHLPLLHLRLWMFSGLIGSVMKVSHLTKAILAMTEETEGKFSLQKVFSSSLSFSTSDTPDSNALIG